MTLVATVVAVLVETNLPQGGTETVVWVAVAAVIVGLYVLLARTRRRSERHYWEQRRRDEERRRNDPDMRNDEAD